MSGDQADPGRRFTREELEAAEPVAPAPPLRRWVTGLVAGVMLGFLFGLGLVGAAALAVLTILALVGPKGEAATPGAALGFATVTTLLAGVFALALRRTLPVPVWAIGALGIAAMVAGLVATVRTFRVRERRQP